MKYSLAWGLLPAEARVGESFDEPIRLFRGDKLERLADAQTLGILSTALAAGDIESIYRFGDYTGMQNGWAKSLTVMNGHISMADQRSGKTTPFVSASPLRAFSERFAADNDDAIAEVVVPASRLIAPFMDSQPGHMPNELLIVGGVLPSEVVAVHPILEQVK